MLIPEVDIKDDAPQKGGKGITNIKENNRTGFVGVVNKVNKKPEVQVRDGRFTPIESTPKTENQHITWKQWETVSCAQVFAPLYHHHP